MKNNLEYPSVVNIAGGNNIAINQGSEQENRKFMDSKKEPDNFSEKNRSSKFMNIIHAENVDINNLDIVHEQKIEIKYLKKIVEEKERLIQEYKHIISDKDNEISSLKRTNSPVANNS